MAMSAPIGIKAAFIEAVRTKSGLAAAAMLGFLVLLAVLVPIFAPYNVVSAWQTPSVWADNPKLAAPEWTEIFSGQHLSRTIILQPYGTPGGFSHVRAVANSTNQTYTLVQLKKSFSFQYDNFPSELTLYVTANFGTSSPLVTVYFDRPDGQEIKLFEDVPGIRAPQPNTYSLSLPSYTDPSYQIYGNIKNWLISKNITTEPEWNSVYNSSAGFYTKPPRSEVLLFAKMNHDMLNPATAQVLKGDNYSFRILVLGFSAQDDANAKAVIYGTVYGLAGTDDMRRDLLVALLWGAPVALAFGLAGALSSVLIQTILGAISGWYGGWIDELVQRAADFYLIIPTLPILIIIGLIYRPGILAILFVLVVFGIVGATTKVVRSIVLQVREDQFIEAARSYGASRRRILFRYILPRVMPYTFALIALTVPAFIFLEASLSFLGLGDPVLPTWGHLLGNAYDGGALFYGMWWWILFPAAGIIFATVAFALLGYAFDKVLNPRLREQ